MEYVTWALFGLAVGIIAKFIMPGKDPGGIIVTTLIGVAGAFIGGFIAKSLGWDTGDSISSWRTWALSIGGALLILLIWKKLIAPNISKNS